jgi:hypothetical protein
MSVLDDRYTSPLFNAATVLIKSICLSTWSTWNNNTDEWKLGFWKTLVKSLV